MCGQVPSPCLVRTRSGQPGWRRPPEECSNATSKSRGKKRRQRGLESESFNKKSGWRRSSYKKTSKTSQPGKFSRWRKATWPTRSKKRLQGTTSLARPPSLDMGTRVQSASLISTESRGNVRLSRSSKPRGGDITGQEDLAHYVRSFYERLYTSEASTLGTSEAREVCWDNTLARVSIVANEELTKELTLKEIKEAIMAMPKDKAPRCNGIPTEFFQEMTEEISPTML
ncbi:unnamed protein product [Sphagnum jensenii]|uniref:Uncharacterized protein n=1 Tax=Sphagnum jensenii TaxID=128206 RepID=A0ABP1B508_9BRYO